MQKKFIVISFIIAVLIWVGYMVSRHLGQISQVEKTNDETYQELIRIAKKSPSSGLVHVARRLNKYNKDKGVYPERLMDLYPEYLPSEAYLTDIDWDYERTGENNFRLTKTIEVDGTQRATMIDQSFRIATVRASGSTAVAEIEDETEEDIYSEEELGVMVASPAPASAGEDEPASEEAVESGETEQTEKIAEAEQTIGPMVATAPEIVSVVQEEIAPGIDSKLGYGYLVWKDEKGRLGFGNVDYPSRYRLSVYKDGAYHDIRRRQSLERKSNILEVIGKEKTRDEIASRMGSQVLVWKNKDGTLGFGNVDYPSSRRLSIYNDGAYRNIRRAQSTERTANLSEAVVGEEKTKDEIASSISRRDLVWRNEDGTLGFGNVDYPKGEDVTHINVNGEWEKK